MRVDFYRIEGAAAAANLLSALQRIQGLPDDANRTATVNSLPLRCYALTVSQRVWRGDIERIRMDNMPVVVRLNGERDELNLDDDQGIGEDTAFRYDQRTQVLAIQSNRRGISASKWGSYFGHFADADDAIVPVVVTQADTAALIIQRLETVRKLHIRVAGTVNPIIGFDANADIGTQLRQVANTAPVIEVTLGMGHASGGFGITAAKRLLQSLWRQASNAVDGGQSVERVDIVGTFDDDTPANLNLMRYFMRDDMEVSPNPATRRVEYDERIRAINEACANRRAELTQMFGA